ncbi:tyrosine-type recombinase/integrase [Deinococcus altitudinis]|uniref:tyrosine-type recombinase/integrase n=1 Tax=Deinococcus altitudinis TaxID=468914 RepID=UPI003891A5F0
MTQTSSASSLVLASKWATSANRRREGLRAAHTQDEAELLDLLTYHLKLKSRQAGGVSPETLKTYTVAVRDFLAFTGPREQPRYAVQSLDEEVVEHYLIQTRQRLRRDHRTEAHLSLGSVSTYLAGVRALYRALTWAGVCQVNPAAQVRAPRDPTPPHTRKRALPNAKVRELFAAAAAQGDPEVAARDGALLTLGVTLGLRASEIVGLDVTDVGLALIELHVRHGKGGKARRIPIPNRALATLQLWLQLRTALQLKGEVPAEQTALLVSFHRGYYGRRLSIRGLRDVVNRYFAQVGLPPDMWGVHTLRRTAGTRLYRQSRDLHVVSDILGHSSVTTSAIYAKLDTQIRRDALSASESLDD